jgi:hypothetical protein
VALETLGGTYWYPLYACARRRGLGPESAEDGVQSLIADLLARRHLERLDPARGRFRAFLLAAFRNYLALQRERERTLKRGGGRSPLSLELEHADERYALASGRAGAGGAVRSGLGPGDPFSHARGRARFRSTRRGPWCIALRRRAAGRSVMGNR